MIAYDPLATRTLQLLLGLLLLSIFVLVPGQSRVVLGIEIGLLGVAMVVLAGLSMRRSHFPVVQLRWTAGTVVLALLSTGPMVVAGVSITLGGGGGLYWAVFELAAGFAMTIYNAWILLIEIKR
jgi:modulator of FtsH protease